MVRKLRGELGGDKNLLLLQRYLSALRSQCRGLPARTGKPNFSLIAAGCGFDRGVFYQNKAARKVLDDAALELGLETSPPENTVALDGPRLINEAGTYDDRRARTVEEEILYLRAENMQLKADNARLRAHARVQLMAITRRIP